MSNEPDEPALTDIERAPSQRFAILLSHERSGSHYLANMLTSGSPIASLDEVCNFNAVNPDTGRASFFRFDHEYRIAEPDLLLRPTAEAKTRFTDRYFEHLAGLVNSSKTIWLDIKYGHVHNFEIGWWPSERRPFLLDYLERRDIRVVHLVRADSVAAVASSLIAEQTGVWHRRDGRGNQEVAKVRLPALKVAHDALALEREKENFFAWLSSNRCFALEYEQLAGPEAQRDAVMTDLCAFLGLPRRSRFSSNHRKVTPPLGEIVENFDELVRAVRLFGGGRLRMGKQ
ncbi:MAG: Stf0 family sulfotransferase [Rhizomicrobium sp.]